MSVLIKELKQREAELRRLGFYEDADEIMDYIEILEDEHPHYILGDCVK